VPVDHVQSPQGLGYFPVEAIWWRFRWSEAFGLLGRIEPLDFIEDGVHFGVRDGVVKPWFGHLTPEGRVLTLKDTRDEHLELSPGEVVHLAGQADPVDGAEVSLDQDPVF
jgi:hypothetical protein